MSVVVFVETPDNNRGRFIADDPEAALRELSRQFPIGATVAERLRKGERIVTEQYTLCLRPLQTEAPKRQKQLF